MICMSIPKQGFVSGLNQLSTILNIQEQRAVGTL